MRIVEVANPIHSLKFQKFYLGLVKHVSENITACPSRGVAALIVDKNHRILGLGYNGPPAGTPHCNTLEYLQQVVEPQVPSEARSSLILSFGSLEQAWENCKGCPRKFLGYKSGEATHLCSCVHAEINALINAAKDVTGSVMYCSLTPCQNCAASIVNARIAEVHYPEADHYSPTTPWILDQGQVKRFEHSDIQYQRRIVHHSARIAKHCD